MRARNLLKKVYTWYLYYMVYTKGIYKDIVNTVSGIERGVQAAPGDGMGGGG